MSDDGIHVPYNRDLKKLEKLLSGVRRPGDFFVEASFETALPRVEIADVGTLSFPVPAAQVRQLVAQANRAPFGRGEQTILDESVRKVWQLPPDRVRLGGKSWDKTFARILSAVADGLGCAQAGVTAELYKLLIYDKGGFFAVHRDTEKTAGMFGTLIVVLPCEHTGGELIVRHAGREVILDLSGAETSELRVAAFYADCEHEVRPVTGGHRVCLVYNLLQPRTGKGSRPLAAPAYHGEIEQAAATLREAFAGKGAPAKLAWLFKHEYSPAGLSFAGLKGEDATLAKVLRRAAEAADCAVHLGIVHIEETGPAEPDYSDYRGGWYDEGPDEEDTPFEAVEVSESEWHVGEWHDTEDHPVDFGDVPLGGGEVLPAEALDGEKPDEQRLLEATGNEGASFERSYHRAALVLWPRDRFADVLLQAGVAAVLPYFAERVAACDGAAAKAAPRRPVLAIARRVLGVWEQEAARPGHVRLQKDADRAGMLTSLTRLGDAGLLERFIGGVITKCFDGSENETLAAAVTLLEPPAVGKHLSVLARVKMREAPGAVAGLLDRLWQEVGEPPAARWKKALMDMAAAIVAALSELKPLPPTTLSASSRTESAYSRLVRLRAQMEEEGFIEDDWDEPDASASRAPGAADAAFVTSLLTSLRALGADALHARAVAAIVADPAAFDPVTVVVPALTALRPDKTTDADLARLWRHTAEFVLARSEEPPAPPIGWSQKITLVCRSEDDRELMAFARDLARREHRFRVKKERRHHLHQTIDRLGLDMTHVTDRTGSPQTLVCTKTRWTFERQCAQHATDVAAMKALLAWPSEGLDRTANRLAARMNAASRRRPSAGPLKAG